MPLRSAIFLLILTSIKAVSQIELDTVAISSTLISMPALQSGRAVTILTQEDLTARPFNSWDELLQQVPGIEIQSRNGFGAQADLLIRGSTFTQVLILIDGMRINDPLTGHFNGNIPIPSAELARIEILRGPAAALYGPDAVGGVINFVTKTWHQPFSKGKQYPGQFNFGRHGLIRADQGFYYSQKNTAVAGGLQVARSKGEYVPERLINGQNTIDGYRNYFDVRTASLSTALRLQNKLTLNLRSAYDYRDFAARYFYTNSPFDESEENTKHWWHQAKLVLVHRNSISEFHVTYRRNRDKFVFNPTFPSTNLHHSTWMQMQFNHQIRSGDRLILKMGVQGDRRSIESTDRGDHRDFHVGVFLLNSLIISDHTYLNLGCRMDYDDNYGYAFLPQLNVTHTISSFHLRATLGKAIRAADYTERYVSFNLAMLTPGRSLGNPDLLPEKSWTAEIGLDFFPSTEWSMKSTLFARNSDRLIDYVSTLADDIKFQENLVLGEQYFYAQNIASVNTLGFELDINYHKRLGKYGYFRTGLGYTTIRTENQKGIASVYLSNHARHLITGRYQLKLGRWSIGSTGLLKVRNTRFAESILADLEGTYMVFDGRLKYQWRPKISFQAQVNNIFDQSYSNILGAPMPRRWWQIGLSWDLSQGIL